MDVGYSFLSKLFLLVALKVNQSLTFALMSIGMLTRHEYHMTVGNAVGSFEFRLFHHIQVLLRLHYKSRDVRLNKGLLI